MASAMEERSITTDLGQMLMIESLRFNLYIYVCTRCPIFFGSYQRVESNLSSVIAALSGFFSSYLDEIKNPEGSKVDYIS